MTVLESALIVPLAEAEPVVGPYRAALDRAAGWGVPAHVTVLYPFLPPDEITAGALAVVRDLVAAVPAFEVTFASVRWFGDSVVWLAPEPMTVFRDLSLAVWRRFPGRPPYGGEHGDDVTPHLTIGHDAPVAALRDAADAVGRALPFTAAATHVQLITGSAGPGSWRTYETFPLRRAVRR